MMGTMSTLTTTTNIWDNFTGNKIYSGDLGFVAPLDSSITTNVKSSINPKDNNTIKYVKEYFDKITPDDFTRTWRDPFTFMYEKANLVISYNIKEVNIIVPNKVVEVVFEDDTKEKAVCQEPDVFSLEMAIGICISKKIMGGSSAYNNAIRRGVKIYEKQEKAKAEEEKRKIAAERKRKKRIEKKQKKAELKKDAEKREKIEIQREAYIQAMEYMEHRKNCK